VLYGVAVSNGPPESLVAPFVDGLAERGLLDTAPAATDLRSRVVGIEGDGPIASMVADLLGPVTTVARTSLDPETLAGLDAAVSCTGWLPDAHWQRIDRWCLAAGVAWHRCYSEGGRFHVGPLLVPERTAGYADTRARRLAAARLPDELRGLWAYLDAGGPMPPVPWPDPGGVAVVAGMLVADVLAHLSGRPVPGGDQQLEVDPATLGVTRHAVLPLPRGGTDGEQPGRSTPVAGLVDPCFGLITQVVRAPPVAGVPRAFVDYAADVATTTQFATWAADPVTGGAALGDPERARAAAIGEAVERYCGNAVPDELPVGSAASLTAAGHRVLDPEGLALYSATQYAQPGFPFTPLTTELEVSWVPGHDLDTGDEVLVPAALVHLNLHRTRSGEPAILCQAYAGIAAGDGVAQAERSALEELLERDAVTIWWSSGAEAAVLDVDCDPVLTPVLTDARACGLDVNVLRIPCVFDVPVVGVFLEDRVRGLVGFGSACRSTPGAAAQKALTEALVTYTITRELAEHDGAADPDALRGVSFAIPAGATVALVGHSGSGKSTCANLLMRFWDPREGSVRIDGVDTRELPVDRLRDLVALVPQDVYLFNDTVRANILLGRPDATDAEVSAAVDRALVAEFVPELPDGLDTVIGERGATLSGGQRQRIAIARALLKNAPILVMDEAVSNLDTENEQALHAAMAEVRRGRTALLIAHRLSTIRSADLIVTLEDGRVAEAGRYDELVRAGGTFARLVAAQRHGRLDR